MDALLWQEEQSHDGDGEIVVKSTCYACRGPWFGFLHPHGGKAIGA